MSQSMTSSTEVVEIFIPKAKIRGAFGRNNIMPSKKNVLHTMPLWNYDELVAF